MPRHGVKLEAAEMDTYEIRPERLGFFEVIVTAPNGASWVRAGFVSEKAAQKWVEKYQKRESHPPTARVRAGQRSKAVR